MFGYIRILKPQMKICEFEQYQAVYCTLCRTIGKRYGPFARMLLSYDYTFVAMLGLEFEQNEPRFENGRCSFNPLRKRGRCVCAGEAFELTAALTAVMFYHKVRDNIADSGFFAKIGWRAVKLAAYPIRRKAAKLFPDIDLAVSGYIDRQLDIERDEGSSLDLAAEPTAQLISQLAARFSDDKEKKPILERMGYFLGRWIYFIDALDDLEQDVKEGGYNPFARKFALEKSDISEDSGRLLEAKIYANECLNMSISAFIESYERLKPVRFKPILDNIVFLGMGNSQRTAMRIKENDAK